jgi:small subunit ribosomal protein S20
VLKGISMANTRQSTKRARQTIKRHDRNQLVRGNARKALKDAVVALKSKDMAKIKTAYAVAVKTLSKAGSKGSFPPARVARKISRLTLLVKKSVPEIFKTK